MSSFSVVIKRDKVTLSQLTKTFLFIGVTSFGGGITAYVRRIIVDNKKWLTNEEFFPGLALAQLLPGANVVGISLYIGNHLCGLIGAVIAMLCIVLPPAFLFFGLGYLYFSLGALPAVESMLKGAGAIACGMMATMFIEAAQASLKNAMDLLIFLGAFVLVHFAHLHIPYVILIVAPMAIWWYRPKK
ncbi:MAG: chromate transporter [Chthoniobacterales bacterium]|nr:chromate transporter [Chthoniobacterales bacterium]